MDRSPFARWGSRARDGFVFTFIVRARPLTGVVQRLVNQPTAYPTSGASGYGSWSSANPTGVYTSTQPLSSYGYGPDMMGRGMGGMIGQGYRAGGWNYPVSGAPLTIDEAVSAANRYLSVYSNPDSGQTLILTEVMEVSENFYAEVEEVSTVSLLGGRGYGGWGFSSFGWMGMIFMWLIPVGFIILAVAGVIWLVRAIGGGVASPPAPPRSYPS